MTVTWPRSGLTLNDQVLLVANMEAHYDGPERFTT